MRGKGALTGRRKRERESPSENQKETEEKSGRGKQASNPQSRQGWNAYRSHGVLQVRNENDVPLASADLMGGIWGVKLKALVMEEAEAKDGRLQEPVEAKRLVVWGKVRKPRKPSRLPFPPKSLAGQTALERPESRVLLSGALLFGTLAVEKGKNRARAQVRIIGGEAETQKGQLLGLCQLNHWDHVVKGCDSVHIYSVRLGGGLHQVQQRLANGFLVICGDRCEGKFHKALKKSEGCKVRGWAHPGGGALGLLTPLVIVLELGLDSLDDGVIQGDLQRGVDRGFELSYPAFYLQKSPLRRDRRRGRIVPAAAGKVQPVHLFLELLNAT